jgi:hypothetical protein
LVGISIPIVPTRELVDCRLTVKSFSRPPASNFSRPEGKHKYRTRPQQITEVSTPAWVLKFCPRQMGAREQLKFPPMDVPQNELKRLTLSSNGNPYVPHRSASMVQRDYMSHGRRIRLPWGVNSDLVPLYRASDELQRSKLSPEPGRASPGSTVGTRSNRSQFSPIRVSRHTGRRHEWFR